MSGLLSDEQLAADLWLIEDRMNMFGIRSHIAAINATIAEQAREIERLKEAVIRRAEDAR